MCEEAKHNTARNLQRGRDGNRYERQLGHRLEQTSRQMPIRTNSIYVQQASETRRAKGRTHKVQSAYIVGNVGNANVKKREIDLENVASENLKTVLMLSA